MAVETDTPVTETLRVARWRSERFQSLGYDESHADLLAHHGVDWHVLAELVASGCPLALAEAIMT
jgi:hypothetical protein